MYNKMQTETNSSLFSTGAWAYSNSATLYNRDIHQPWKSAYGFAVSAARLAAGQPLVLHCREDEIFENMAALNTLLKHPVVLQRAAAMLINLKEASEQKLERLVEIEEQPISESQLADIIQAVEEFLTTDRAELTVFDRLEESLIPPHIGDEKVGLQKMVDKLEGMIAALEQVKATGFHVVVQDRRRQPARPALEMQQSEAAQHNGQSAQHSAGLVLPTQYHLTLWSYAVVRNDHGQSPIWN
ncbi:MAG: hypothetical protein KDJ52_07150 [Anaerolineae bacterium]|nr:hypothetical protein [Anaerolineae bacterium]